MILYWQGKLPLDAPDRLLARFYKNAPDALRFHSLATVGRALRDTKDPIPDEILHRLRTLWEKRLSAARERTSSDADNAELTAFGWWFISGKFEDPWAITQLTEALRLTGKVELDLLVVERLAQLTAAFPGEAVECLRLMVEGDTEDWHIAGWHEHVRTILTIAIQGADIRARQASVDLIHRLGARKYPDFRDILAKLP